MKYFYLIFILAAFSCFDEELIPKEDELELEERNTCYATVFVPSKISFEGFSDSTVFSPGHQDLKFYIALSRPDNKKVIELVEINSSGYYEINNKTNRYDSTIKGEKLLITEIALLKSERKIFTQSVLLEVGDTISFFERNDFDNSNIGSIKVNIIDYFPTSNMFQTRFSYFINDGFKTSFDMPLPNDQSSKLLVSTSLSPYISNSLKKYYWISPEKITAGQIVNIDFRKLVAKHTIYSQPTQSFFGNFSLNVTFFGIEDIEKSSEPFYIAEYYSQPVSSNFKLPIPDNFFSEYRFKAKGKNFDSTWINYSNNFSDVMKKYNPSFNYTWTENKLALAVTSNSDVDLVKLEFKPYINARYMTYSSVFSFYKDVEIVFPEISILEEGLRFNFYDKELQNVLFFNGFSIDLKKEVVSYYKTGNDIEHLGQQYQLFKINLSGDSHL